MSKDTKTTKLLDDEIIIFRSYIENLSKQSLFMSEYKKKYPKNTGLVSLQNLQRAYLFVYLTVNDLTTQQTADETQPLPSTVKAKMLTNFNLVYGNPRYRGIESETYQSYIKQHSLYSQIKIHGLWRYIILTALDDIYSDELCLIDTDGEQNLTDCKNNIENSLVPFFNIFLDEDFSCLTKIDINYIEQLHTDTATATDTSTSTSTSTEVGIRGGTIDQIFWGSTITTAIVQGTVSSLLLAFSAPAGGTFGLIYLSLLARSREDDFKSFLNSMQRHIHFVSIAYFKYRGNPIFTDDEYCLSITYILRLYDDIIDDKYTIKNFVDDIMTFVDDTPSTKQNHFSQSEEDLVAKTTLLQTKFEQIYKKKVVIGNSTFFKITGLNKLYEWGRTWGVVDKDKIIDMHILLLSELISRIHLWLNLSKVDKENDVALSNLKSVMFWLEIEKRIFQLLIPDKNPFDYIKNRYKEINKLKLKIVNIITNDRKLTTKEEYEPYFQGKIKDEKTRIEILQKLYKYNTFLQGILDMKGLTYYYSSRDFSIAKIVHIEYKKHNPSAIRNIDNMFSSINLEFENEWFGLTKTPPMREVGRANGQDLVNAAFGPFGFFMGGKEASKKERRQQNKINKFQKMTVKELREKAKTGKVCKYYKLRKDDLIKALCAVRV